MRTSSLCLCVFVCVCVFPFPCCRCDTFITGDTNELKLKLWKGTRGKKWALTVKKRGTTEEKEKGKGAPNAQTRVERYECVHVFA